MSQELNLCACGCGEPAGFYATSNSKAGIVAGQSKKFIHGHHGRVGLAGRKPATFEECYTVEPDGCWRWKIIHPGGDGYGRYWIQGRSERAHRISYSKAHGPIPGGARVDHTCHDPKFCKGGAACPHRACVNPDHLEVVTHAENCRRGSNSKLTREQVQEIYRRRQAGERGVALAREFAVAQSTISWINTGKTWGGVT